MPARLTRRALLVLSATAIGVAGGLAGIVGVASNRERPGDQWVSLGGLRLMVSADPWRLSLLAPDGGTLWEEATDHTLNYRTSDGQLHRAQRLAGFRLSSPDVVQMVAETDDPAGGV